MVSYCSQTSDYEKKHRVLLCKVSDWIYGGVETYIYSVAKYIDSTDIQVDCYTPCCMKDESYLNKMLDLGVNMYAGNQDSSKVLDYVKIYNDMKKLIDMNNYTAIHVNTGSPLFQSVCLSVAKRKVPIRICHSHNATAPDTIPLIKKILYVGCRFVIRNSATHFFACSELAGNFLFGKRTMSRKGRIIKNGIDYEKFRFNEKHRMTIRTQLQLHEDIPLLGLVANFTEQKNHVFLIKVFSELLKHVPNAELVLLGGNSNDETAYEKLKIFADSLGISENIHFMGTVKNANEYYSAMDIFVMPSLWEGLPYAGIEAQASCLPCLFSDSISNELTVSQWANFFSLKNGEKAWAERIHELLTTNNCHTRSQFSEKTREEIREHGYDLKESVACIENLYMSLEVAQWQT